jgi:hypothetical protein
MQTNTHTHTHTHIHALAHTHTHTQNITQPLTSKSESLNSYAMFQPSMRNLRLSMSTAWKKHRQNSRRRYLSCALHRVNCDSVIVL